MKNPTLTMAHNLRWTRDGSVWADFILQGVAYGSLMPRKDKEPARQLHQALFRALPGDSLLMGLLADVDPARIVDQMIGNRDMVACPEWLQECEATLDSLDDLQPGERIFWLSVPLKRSPLAWLLDSVNSQIADAKDQVGFVRAAPSQQQIEHFLRLSHAVQQAIPGRFAATPATPAQMLWQFAHCLRRGVTTTDFPVVARDALTEQLLPKNGVAMSTPVFDEGGASDVTSVRARSAVWNRKFLKIWEADALEDSAPSYQSLMVITDVPTNGITFPDAELIGRIDEFGLPLDWAIRSTVRSSQKVAGANQRALTELNDQFHHQSATVSTKMSVLERTAEELSEYAAILDNDKLEVEILSTIVFAVSGTSAAEAMEVSQLLAANLRDCGFKASAPLGYQQELWWSMIPGVPHSGVIRRYAQIATSLTMASLMPLASVALGDPRGSLLGINTGHGPMLTLDRACGPAMPVLHDFESASDKDQSGSIAIAGEPGAGKTSTLMKLAGDILDKDGQIVVADRTAKGEWAIWAKMMTSVTVVDVQTPEFCMDPLRMFGLKQGARILHKFLSPLLNIKSTSDRGITLSTVLDPQYLAAANLTTQNLASHLEKDCDLHEAKVIGMGIRAFANQPFGRCVFGDLPTLDVSNGSLVIRTHGLDLPTREELGLGHRFDELSVDKVFARAFHVLIAEVARKICFADDTKQGAFVVPEAHAMTISDEGELSLRDFVRDGRKHRAAVLLDSHDPESDFGSQTMRGLIGVRLLMRQKDRRLAERSLRWLDLEPTEELIDLVTTDLSPVVAANSNITNPMEGVMMHRRGEALMRDTSGRPGRLKILWPARPERRDAILRATAAGRSQSTVAA